MDEHHLNFAVGKEYSEKIVNKIKLAYENFSEFIEQLRYSAVHSGMKMEDYRAVMVLMCFFNNDNSD